MLKLLISSLLLLTMTLQLGCSVFRPDSTRPGSSQVDPGSETAADEVERKTLAEGEPRNEEKPAVDEISTAVPQSDEPSATIPGPTVIRPSAPNGVWDIPLVPSLSLNGDFSLFDLAILVKTDGFEASNKALELAVSEENYTRIHAEAHLSTSGGGSNITYSERKQLDEFTDLLNANLRQYSVVVADQILSAHKKYSELLGERQKIAIAETNSVYLNNVLGRVKVVIETGDAPTSWASRIGGMIISNDLAMESGVERIAHIASDLAQLTGGIDPVLLKNMAGTALPDLDTVTVPLATDIANAALDRSPEIQSLIFLRSASENKVQRLYWEHQQIANPTSAQQIAFLNATELESIRIEDLNLKLFEADSKIRNRANLSVELMIVAIQKYETAGRALSAATIAYMQGIYLFENGEINMFELLDLSEEVYLNHSRLAALAFDYLNAQTNINRLLFEDIYSIALDPPEGM